MVNTSKNTITQTDNSLLKWLIGRKEYRPLVLIIAGILFCTLYFMPAPDSLTTLIGNKDPLILASENNQTVLESIQKALNQPELTVEEAAQKIKIVTGMILVAALLWGTVSIPIGVTAFLLALIMYFTNLIPASSISKLYMSDSVFFLIGVLTIAVGIEKTGFNKRLGLITLGWTKNRYGLLFIFGPLMAIAAMFVSAKCLIAFLMPVLMCLYKRICRANGIERHPDLGLFLIFTILYMTAMGGPGAPSVGARNVIMMELFSELGKPMTFIQWMKYGFWFVPVGSAAVGLFLMLVLGRKIKLKINPGKHMCAECNESELVGNFGGKEAIMVGILALVIIMWITMGSNYGLGGPAIFGLVLMFLFGIVKWDDVNNNVSWGVVWMYAAAVGMGKLILETGTGLWLATLIFNMLPDFMKMNEGLLITVSILTTIITNLMNDGAAVAVIGPITLSMSSMAEMDIWKIGLATAYSSSFAHALLIGRPGLIIAYTLGRDPETGEQLLDLWRLFKYGCAMILISWIILWGWVFLGYWRFMTF